METVLITGKGLIAELPCAQLSRRKGYNVTFLSKQKTTNLLFKHTSGILIKNK